MKKSSKTGKKAADEDETGAMEIRSSRGKRRRGRRSRSRSRSGSRSPDSDSPARKRSKKKIVDKKSEKNKGSRRRRRRRRSPSSSPSDSLRHGSSSSSASERSVSPPPRSRSRDAKKGKGRGKDREKDRKRRRAQRSRSHSRGAASSGSGSDSSRGRSKSKSTKRAKRRAAGLRDDARKDKVAQDYDNRHVSRTEKNLIEDDDWDEEAAAKIAQDNYNRHVSHTEKNWIEDADRDEEAVAVAKEENYIGGFEKNAGLEVTESPPPSRDDDETGQIFHASTESPEAEDLELILRQKALENFRKFRGAAVMAGETGNSGIGKEVVTNSPQNTVMKSDEPRTAIAPSQRQDFNLGVSRQLTDGISRRLSPTIAPSVISLPQAEVAARLPRFHGSANGLNHSLESPRSNDFGKKTSSLQLESNPGISRGAGSPGLLEAADTSIPIEQQGSDLEKTHPTPLNSGSVMQRLGSLPRVSSTVKQRLGSSVVVNRVNETPKVRSSVSIPAREGLDGSTFITSTLMASESSAPVESSREVRHPPLETRDVRHPPLETKDVEGTNGVDNRKTTEASTPNGSISSTAEGNTQAGIEGKDGSQFEKKTFSRMHDGETVEVSYKVYIPKRSPALARRKLQR